MRAASYKLAAYNEWVREPYVIVFLVGSFEFSSATNKTTTGDLTRQIPESSPVHFHEGKTGSPLNIGEPLVEFVLRYEIRGKCYKFMPPFLKVLQKLVFAPTENEVTGQNGQNEHNIFSRKHQLVHLMGNVLRTVVSSHWTLGYANYTAQ